MTRELSLRVVGAEHPNSDGGNRRTEIMFCDPGEFIELRLEPKNPADSNAVAVYSPRGFQIGYLQADRAPWIGGFMRQEREIRAIFQEVAPWGAVIRIALDGADPTLPPSRPGLEAPNFRHGQKQDPWPDGVDWVPPDE